MRTRIGLALGAAMSAVGLAVAVASPAQAAPLPVEYNWLTGFVANLPNAQLAPPGAIAPDAKGNVAPCISVGKKPIVLVHGTIENMYSNWAAAAPLLKNAGFCVYAFNFGGNPNDAFYGTKAVASNAKELAVFIDKVRAATLSNQVDILGHSQGGMLPRQYIKFDPSAWTGGSYGVGVSKVDKLVALSPSNHGTTLLGIANLGRAVGVNELLGMFAPGFLDQAVGSKYMANLATCPKGLPSADICAGDTTNYTVIQTTGDQVVTPYTAAFLTPNPAAKGSLKNILLQDECPQDFSEHLGITYDSYAYGLVLKAFGIANPASVPGASPGCKFITPYVGG